MAQPRVLLGFADASDHVLEETTGHVLAGFYNSSLFPTPPVTEAALQAALKTFTDSIAAQSQGGSQATAAKEAARAALIGALRQLAAFVQSVMLAHPAYGLAELLASGFDAVSTNRASQPLAKPVIRAIDNTGEGQLTLRADAVRNSRQYEARYRLGGAPDWLPGKLFNSTRGLVIDGLTPGAMYDFQLRALGGSTGASEWSDAVSHRSL